MMKRWQIKEGKNAAKYLKFHGRGEGERIIDHIVERKYKCNMCVV